jgi:hypothetical protein
MTTVPTPARIILDHLAIGRTHGLRVMRHPPAGEFGAVIASVTASEMRRVQHDHEQDSSQPSGHTHPVKHVDFILTAARLASECWLKSLRRERGVLPRS